MPSGVEVTLRDRNVRGEGPAGQPCSATCPARSPSGSEDATLLVERPDDERDNRALHGLTRTLIANMVTGVTAGFTKDLEIVGVGYRATLREPAAARAGARLQPPGLRRRRPKASPSRCRAPSRIIVKGIDKETVGQVAADIRKIRKPEPYKGKGVRYAGEVVQRKAGKAAK